MDSQYPDDTDGDALRRVAADGSDMTRPMRIDFSLTVPDVASARSVVEVVSAHGFEPKISVSPGDSSVSVYCAKTMLATYDGVVASQAELNRLCKCFGAECDGWGTFGNRWTQ
jgi:hypothetical protein